MYGQGLFFLGLTIDVSSVSEVSGMTHAFVAAMPAHLPTVYKYYYYYSVHCSEAAVSNSCVNNTGGETELTTMA